MIHDGEPSAGCLATDTKPPHEAFLSLAYMVRLLRVIQCELQHPHVLGYPAGGLPVQPPPDPSAVVV
eukprot:CAMPEP_0195592912 /NCGR_PEP_ID=MMETSP0815-20121206/608_1 /TAXON_ID=97485 /ORGANISM="Prymnesium parvum, Strain Texoma1" /LENGTH=66 /DNA_ID=CAMNT_0040732025 /DNA_START=2021 /DNA_END=2221 /DNA_ORIENTATION=-